MYQTHSRHTRGKRMKKEITWRIPVLLMIVGLGMCAVGAVTGEAGVIFMQAARICMECIGLG